MRQQALALQQQLLLPQTSLAKAVNYLVNEYHGLTRYLPDPKALGYIIHQVLIQLHHPGFHDPDESDSLIEQVANRLAHPVVSINSNEAIFMRLFGSSSSEAH